MDKKKDEDVITHHMRRIMKNREREREEIHSQCRPNYPFIIFFICLIFLSYIGYRLFITYIPPFFSERGISNQKQKFFSYIDSEVYKVTLPALLTSKPKNVTIVDRYLLLSKNGPVFPIRIYQPTRIEGESFPSLVWVHGSNFLSGRNVQSPDHALCQALASHGILVYSITYRYSETYPTPLLDVVEGVKWVYHNTHEFGGDSSMLCIGGHDAGANLAMAATWYIRDRTTAEDVQTFPEDLEIKYVSVLNPMMLFPLPESKSSKSYRQYKYSGFYIDQKIYETILEYYIFGYKKAFVELPEMEKEYTRNQTTNSHLFYPGKVPHLYMLPSFYIIYSQHLIFRDEITKFIKILEGFQLKEGDRIFKEHMMDHCTQFSWDPVFVGYKIAQDLLGHFEKNIYVKF